jgi:7-alpha-hydroxysteroid dehydrogenase
LAYRPASRGTSRGPAARGSPLRSLAGSIDDPGLALVFPRDDGTVIDAAGQAVGAAGEATPAQDLAPRIRVNAIAADTIATAATEVITADAGLRSRVEAATPLRRLGTVDDVAAAVLYLASPASAYLTGTVLEVHGGLQAPNTQQPLPDL